MSKKMVKIMSVLTSIAMTAVLVAGCGASGSSETEKTTAGSGVASTAAASTASEKPKDVTLKYLVVWNGSGTVAAEDPVNNPVAKAFKEKTGVTLEVEYGTIAENEKLNLVFASGDMPDMINGPFWGGSDTSTQIFKKAAREGLLTPIDDYLANAPLVKKALTEGVAVDFRENDLEDPAFGGKHYFIPWQTAGTKDDVTNWAYNAFARKDILDALKVQPSDIKTSEDVYALAKKIRDGSFKDANG